MEVEEPSTNPEEDDLSELAPATATTPTAMAAPTLSKSWSIASAHVPIYTGGKVVPCHLQVTKSSSNTASTTTTKSNDDNKDTSEEQNDAATTEISCLLLQVNGDIAIVDAERGIKLGSVRTGTVNPYNHNDDDDDDDGIDVDAISAYALSANQKTLVTCTQNQLVRQYTCQATTTTTSSATGNADDDPSNQSSTTAVAFQLQKTWGRSGHSLPVTDMQFHSSGVFVASASVDGSVRIWDVRGGHVTHIFRPLAGGSGGGSGRLSATSISWLDDISHLVIAIGRDDGSIAIHDLRDQDMKHVVVLRDHLSAVTCMDWWWKGSSHDDAEDQQHQRYPSMFVTTSRDAVLNFWSIDKHLSSTNKQNAKAKKGKNKKSKQATDPKAITVPVYRREQTIPLYEQVEGMAILPDEDDDDSAIIVATAGSKGVVRLWKAYQADDGDISGPVLSAEQTTAQEYGEARGGYLGLSHMKSTTNSSNSGEGSVHQNQLVVADGEHCLSFLSLDTSADEALETARTIVGFNDEILDLRVIPSLEKAAEPSSIVVATNSAQVRIFDLDNFSCHVLDGHTATVLCVDVSPCGRYIATSGKDKKMCIWHTESKKCVATAVGHTEAIGATALSKKAGRYDVGGKAAKNGGGAFAVTVSLDRTLKRWNLPGSADLNSSVNSKTSEKLSLDAFVSARAHEKDINVVSVAPNDSLVATGSQDKTVKLWHSTDLTLMGTLKGHRRGVWDCQFSPFDRVVATCSGDRSIRLWSLSDYSCVRTFQGHVSSVLRVRFLNGGLQLVSSGADGLVKLWTIRTNECEATMDGHSDRVWALDVASVGTTMISGGADSQLLVWKDTTTEAEDVKRAEREEAILMDQRLANHLRHKEFAQALNIALHLDKPRLALKVFTSIVETDVKEKRSPITSLQTYVPKWSTERIAQVLGYCREWNTRARNCDVAMLVIRAIVSVVPADKLAGGAGVPEVLAGITPYAERHFDRLDRLFASSYLLDFALYSMGNLDISDDKDFTTWETQSKLVLPPQYEDGKMQIGGNAIVGGNGRPLGSNVSDDDDVSTVGDSDSSDDEAIEEKEADPVSSPDSSSDDSSKGGTDKHGSHKKKKRNQRKSKSGGARK